MDVGRGTGSPAVPLEEVARRLGVPLDDDVRAAARRFPIRFPRPYLELADPDDPHDPIRRIGWPDPEELAPDPDAVEDPVGEQDLLAHPLVIRKYSDRAILLVTSRCHFYCRFCFRAGHRKDPAPDEIAEAVDAIGALTSVREVILSGGDPLVLPDARLASILDELSRLSGLETVRLHTRTPVHDPARITDALAKTLADHASVPLWLVIHATHPRELTSGLDEAIGRLHAAGIPLLSQTVLLRGVNDDPQRLAELFSGLYARRVRPYYLHHPDRVRGTRHFRVSIDRGRGIYRQLRSLVPGPALPQYVLDLPDGSGKVPVDWLVRRNPGVFTVKRPDGSQATYVDIGRSGNDSNDDSEISGLDTIDVGDNASIVREGAGAGGPRP